MACHLLTAAAPNCAIFSRMQFETLTCGSLHGRAGDCSSVLGHSACVWFWGTGCWRGGCWVQQCPRFPLQKKMRIFLLLSLLSYTTHDHYTLFSASNKQGTVEHDILLMAMTGSFKNLLNQYVYSRNHDPRKNNKPEIRHLCLT